MGFMGLLLQGPVLVLMGCLALNFGRKSHVQVVVEPALLES